MPTREKEPQFLREFVSLTSAQQARFLDAVRKMVSDMRAGQPFRPGLRVKGVQGHTGVFEMIWARHLSLRVSYPVERIPYRLASRWRPRHPQTTLISSGQV